MPHCSAAVSPAIKTRSCEIVWAGTGAAGILQAGDDTVAVNSCFNKIGVIETIIGVYAKTDGAGMSMTVNPVFGAAGSGTTICSGALTVASSNAYSSTCTVSNASLADGSGISPVMGGTLTGTNVHMLVVYTTP